MGPLTKGDRRRNIGPRDLTVRPVARNCRTSFVPLLAGLLLLFGWPCWSAGQTLDLLRHEVREKDPPPADEESKKREEKKSDRNKHRDNDLIRDDCVDDDDDDDDSPIWGEVFFWGLTSPLWAPGMLLGDDFTFDGYFPLYPYADGLQGSMLIDDHGNQPARGWAGRLLFEGAPRTDDVERWGGRLQLSTAVRLDLDSEWNWLGERTATGEDHLALGDLNFVVRIAQTQRIQMRTGLGFNWLADSRGADFGFNFTYGADLFPVKPLVLSSVIDWGTLHHASLFHARGTVGVLWHRLEVFAGYDYRRIGVVDFQGPVAGVQLHF